MIVDCAGKRADPVPVYLLLILSKASKVWEDFRRFGGASNQQSGHVVIAML